MCAYMYVYYTQNYYCATTQVNPRFAHGHNDKGRANHLGVVTGGFGEVPAASGSRQVFVSPDLRSHLLPPRCESYHVNPSWTILRTARESRGPRLPSCRNTGTRFIGPRKKGRV